MLGDQGGAQAGSWFGIAATCRAYAPLTLLRVGRLRLHASLETVLNGRPAQCKASEVE